MIEFNNQKMYFGDLHIHSRFSRACSHDLNLGTLEKWARVKGLDLLGTGDFTHPEWLKELKENLIDKGNGIFYTKTGFPFVLTGEISLIYTQERGRKVHLVLLVPSFESVDKINSWLDTKGRRDYDGRPIFKISCEDFVAKMNLIDEKIEVICAHCWTPHFGIFGSESGFDSLKEAFKSQVEKIHAIETGISSDRNMNFGLNELKNRAILSFSDSHSYWPWRLGREATIFSSIESYNEILREIRENNFIGTIEVDPAYGKYHFDGHRNCDFSCSPEETKKLNGLCPKCGGKLTIGVDFRVRELKNDEEKDKKIEFRILPLHEILALGVNSGMNTKKVWEIYNKLISEFGNEFNVLLVNEKEKILKFANEKIVELILKNREGRIDVKPGYDGVYGIAILDKIEDETNNQKKLF
jgi:uncharacterized protein (TIGR00375 family)